MVERPQENLITPDLFSTVLSFYGTRQSIKFTLKIGYPAVFWNEASHTPLFHKIKSLVPDIDKPSSRPSTLFLY